MTVPQVAVVGASWGGLEAVGRLLADLDPASELAIVVVQHRSPDAPEAVLARYLQARSPLPVREADDKDALEPGRVHVAPPDYHLLVERGYVALSLEAPVHHARPSIDVAFESAADAYGAEAVGVLLTGANEDGARGLLRIADAGGMTFAQDPESAERREMPDAAIACGAAKAVLGIEGIAAELNALGGRR
jgi:two-component system, chemotaxis family, protein-glutamate methylesterase/glutaminase